MGCRPCGGGGWLQAQAPASLIRGTVLAECTHSTGTGPRWASAATIPRLQAVPSVRLEFHLGPVQTRVGLCWSPRARSQHSAGCAWVSGRPGRCSSPPRARRWLVVALLPPLSVEGARRPRCDRRLGTQGGFLAWEQGDGRAGAWVGPLAWQGWSYLSGSSGLEIKFLVLSFFPAPLLGW